MRVTGIHVGLAASFVLLGAGQAASPAAGLKVTVGQPRTISSSATAEGQHLFPALWRLRDGTLLLDYHIEGDIDPARRACLRSVDNGQTWTPDPPRVYREDSVVQLSDGTVLGYDDYTLSVAPGSKQSKGVMFRSRDGGKTFEGPIEVIVNMLRASREPSPNPNYQYSMLFWRSILELPDGSLLASLYGWWAGDAKWRSVAAISKDKGLTFDYLSTVGYDPALGEGYNESVFCWTRAGDILCMMRNGSGTGQALRQARSTNYGRTWSKPEIVGADSVDPDLVLMSNGVLACSYGRPGCWIMFDPTGTGRKWQKPIQVFGGGSTCYTGIREIAPGRLLYVYDATNFDDGSGHGPANCLRAVEITVERQ